MDKIKAYGICIYKKTNKSYEILLCKSVLSNTKYGFLKGVQIKGETIVQTAIREFYEESSIKVIPENLENFFFQENEYKDIGIYLVDYVHVKNKDIYFSNNILKDDFLCNENSNVAFFDINNLPIIKTKQKNIAKQIIEYLKLNLS